MPAALDKDPRLLLRDILIRDWDATRVHGYDPGLTPADGGKWLPMSRGWYSEDPQDPSVGLIGPEEGPVGGGTSGYTGFRGDGSGLNSDRDGTVTVATFAEDASTGGESYPDAGDAAAAVDAVRREIERIASANATGTGDFRYVNSALLGAPDDTDVTPVVRIEQVALGYGWLKTPPP